MSISYLRNVSARSVSTIVNGKDISDQLISFTLGHTKLDQSGLVKCEGEGTFQAAVEDPNGYLDDRAGQFPKGSPANLSVDAGVLPLNTLRVRETAYNIKGRVLTIQFACLLSLLSMRESDAVRAKICLNKPQRITAVINSLLKEICDLVLIDDIPGWISEPIQGKNVIEICGALAWSAGYFLYLENGEILRAKKFDFSPAIAKTYSSFKLVDYEPMSSGGLPPSKIIIEGSVSYIKKRKTSDGFRSYSYSSNKQIFIEDVFDFESGYRKTTTLINELANELMPWLTTVGAFITSENKVEEYFYEERELTIPAPTTEETPENEKCNEIEKVLVKKVTTSLRPFGVTLGEWVRQHKLDANRNIVYTDIFGEQRVVYHNYYGLIIDYYEETNYKYNYYRLQEDSFDRSLAAQQITSFKQEPQGKVFPKAFKLSATEISDPVFIVNSQERSESWHGSYVEWRHLEKDWQSLAIHRRELADEMIAKDEKDWFVSKNYYTQLVVAEDKITISASGQAQPPAPETASAQWEIKEKHKSFKIEVRSPLADDDLKLPPKTYKVEYPIAQTDSGFDVDPNGELKGISDFKAQAEEIGKRIMALEWGRYKGVKLTDVLLTKYKPMMGFGAIDPEGSYQYWMDGYSVACDKKRFVSGWEGVLTGKKV